MLKPWFQAFMRKCKGTRLERKGWLGACSTAPIERPSLQPLSKQQLRIDTQPLDLKENMNAL